MQLIVGQDNPIEYDFTVTGGFGTLVISNETAWDINENSILRIFNSTHTGEFFLTPNTTYSNTFASGLPTFTWVWPIADLPSGSATADVLLIYLLVSPDQLNISLLQNLQS